MRDLIVDLSILTTISETSLLKLAEKAEWCICDDVEESHLAGNDAVSIDLKIGVLTIAVEENNVKYRFTPSKKLEASIRDTIVNNKNPLEKTVEKSLVNKILHTYKDFL